MISPQESEPAMDEALIYRFRLYIAGDGTNSVQAVANLAALCQTQLANRSETEIVDVFREPLRALEDGVFMTPTLLKLGPAPARKIVGALSQTPILLQALGLNGSPS